MIKAILLVGVGVVAGVSATKLYNNRLAAIKKVQEQVRKVREMKENFAADAAKFADAEVIG